MLSVKPELKQAFNQLCSDVVLHIRVIITVHLREIADISGVTVKDGFYRFRVALMCRYNRVIGEKPVTHGTTLPFPPASVPAARQEPLQGNGCLKVSSAPGQRTDKFRHSPALGNTRLWCFAGQTFLRSNIQGRFPVSTLLPAYGQRQRTHDE